jgi:TonB family protein
MFESLTREKRESQRIAQPMLSFAIHAGLIALAVSRVPEPVNSNVISDPIFQPLVIPDPDAGRTTREVGSETGSPLPRPICQCDIPAPGPIPLDHPIGTALHLDHPGFIPDTGRSILDPGPPGVPGVYREGDLSDSPVLLHFPEPVYPAALRTAGINGAVQVTYVIDVTGDVEPESITIVSSDHPLMTESVRRSLLEAKFQPGKVRGTPVRSLVRQVIRFSLMPM